MEAIYAHWRRWPPVHWLVGAYFGHGTGGGSSKPAAIVRGKTAEQKVQGVEALMRFMDTAKTLQ